MKKHDLKYWLALHRAPFIGTQRFFKLQNLLGKDISELFSFKNRKLIEKLLPEAASNYLAHPNWDSIEQDLKWANETNHHLITQDDSFYPACLREISDPPIVLYVKGCLESLSTPQIGLVGTRNPSFSGQEIAFQFAYELSKNNITITSGLARGIDSYGHKGALEAGGQTIAVLGSGIRQIYPKEHIVLAEKIIAQGAIVSEFPPETPPLAKHFPQRNRIISGLSQGVLVVEAAMKSGSLVTARLANEQGRDVFAIPGSIQNVLSKGCHYLIQEGAKLVFQVEDILEELRLPTQNHLKADVRSDTSVRVLKLEGGSTPNVHLTAKEQKIWGCINFEPSSIDIVALRSGLTIAEVSSILQAFEIKELIVSTPFGYLRKQDNE